jgi:phosphoribosyl 1,2-cyclic phosphodiesterase
MESSMTAKFWGVRGSIPSPGVKTVRYGGNTPCVSVHLPGGRILVLDSGTGIREFGKAAARGSEEIFIILSHAHWDHIHGFPFFLPIYEPNRKIFMFPARLGPTSICGLCLRAKALGDKTILCPLLEQMDGAHFPVQTQNVPSQPKCVTEDEVSFLCSRGIHISCIAGNHPGGSFGYRIEHEGKSLVYLTDNELDPPYRKATEFEGFVEFCRHADVLIHDAQYLERDMPQKHGWGHSLVSQACDLAAKAEVKQLILYHHDPDRSDDELDQMQNDARRQMNAENPHIPCTVAYEGLALTM